MKKLSFVFVILCLFVSSLMAEYNPGMSFSSVLNGVTNIPNTKNSLRIGMSSFRATFLPNNSEGRIVLKKADGSEVKSFKFTTYTLKEPYSNVNIYDTEILDNNTGDYILEFQKDGKVFYKFFFSIDVLKSNNPFKSKDKYYLEGDWSDWGYFYIPDGNPERNISWKIWLRNKTMEKETEAKIVATITDKNNKEICSSTENNSYRLKDPWKRYDFIMAWPESSGKGGTVFYAKELLNKDGDYTLTLKINDEEYGKWLFSIKNNEFVLVGRADRSSADPTTFVEGGLDAFWFKKK